MELHQGTLVVTKSFLIILLDMTHKVLTNQRLASAMCHIVSPLPPSSSCHLNIVSTMELLHTRKGVSSSPTQWYDTGLCEE